MIATIVPPYSAIYIELKCVLARLYQANMKIDIGLTKIKVFGKSVLMFIALLRIGC